MTKQLLPRRYYTQENISVPESSATARPQHGVAYANRRNQDTQPIWAKSFSHTQLKQKKIVFTAYGLERYWLEIANPVRLALSILRNLEFEVYLLQNDTILRLDDPHIRVDQLRAIPKLKNNPIKKRVHDCYRFSADELLLLDSDELRSLCEYLYLDDSSDNKVFYNKIPSDAPKFFQKRENDNAEIKEFIFDTNSKLPFDGNLQLFQKSCNLKSLIFKSDNQWKGKDLYKFIPENIENLSIAFDTFGAFPEQNFPKLRHLHIRVRKESDLNWILPTLKKSPLLIFLYLDLDFQITETNFNSMKKLISFNIPSFCQIQISTKIASKENEYYSLSNRYFCDNYLELKTCNLFNKGVRNSNELIETLQSRCIKELAIYITFDDLPSLETIEKNTSITKLTICSIDPVPINFFKQILQRAPNLEYIVLDLSKPMNIDVTQLNQLNNLLAISFPSYLVSADTINLLLKPHIKFRSYIFKNDSMLIPISKARQWGAWSAQSSSNALDTTPHDLNHNKDIVYARDDYEISTHTTENVKYSSSNTITLHAYFKRFPNNHGASNPRQKIAKYNPENRTFPSINEQQGFRKIAITIEENPFEVSKNDFDYSQYYNFNLHGEALEDYTFIANKAIVFYTETAYDELLRLAIITEHEENAIQYEIEQGEEDGLFYITASQSHTAKVQLLLGTPYQQPYPRHEKFQALIDDIADFGIADENLSPSNNDHMLDTLYRARVGACGERARVFIDRLKRHYPELKDYELQLASGGGHAWLEWRPNNTGHFETLDELGGYPVNLIYAESKPVSQKQLKTKTATSTKKKILTPFKKLFQKTTKTRKQTSHRVKPEKSSMPTPVVIPSPPQCETKTTTPEKEKSTNLIKKILPKDNTFSQEVISASLHKIIEEQTPITAHNFLTDLNSNQPLGRNVLLTLPNATDSFAMTKWLYQKMPEQVYYVHDLDRLRFSYPGEVDTGENWEFSDNVDNHFAYYLDFITANHYQAIIILNLPAKSLIKSNMIAESNIQHRRINGHPIPENTIILTLVDKNHPGLNDPSVLTRQHRMFTLRGDIPNATLPPPQKLPSKFFSNNLSSSESVSLYASDDWFALLVGYAKFDSAGNRVVQPGYLLTATPYSTLTITEPPVNHHDFMTFVHEVNENHEFYFLGQWHTTTVRIHVSSKNHFDDKKLNYSLTVINNVSLNQLDLGNQHHHIIGEYTFERCLRNTVVINNLLTEQPGWIEQAKGNSLTLTITSLLTLTQWYCLIDQCTEYEIKELIIQLTAGISFPSELNHFVKNNLRNDCEDIQEVNIASGGNIICSRAVHAEAHEQENTLLSHHYQPFHPEKNAENAYIRCNMDNLSCDDMLYGFSVNARNQWEKQISHIITVLHAGGTVLLEGTPSQALYDNLSTLFTVKPYLIIENQKVGISGRLIVITDQPIPSWVPTQRCSNFDEPAPEMSHSSQTPSLPVSPDNPDHNDNSWSVQTFMQVNDSRLTTFLTFLENRPFAFLNSSTNSGINKLKLSVKRCKEIIFYEDTTQWLNAADNTEQVHLLWINHATSHHVDWMPFQSMYNLNPSLFHDGKLNPLTQKHKVVFIGDNRYQPQLFKRYPQNTLICPTLPLAYFEHATLYPIFSAAYSADEADNECRTFLESLERNDMDIQSIEAKAILHCANSANKWKKALENNAHHYFLLDSRKACKQAIIDTLNIRLFKQNNPSLANKGHNGILIEALPETGKTSLIRSTLEEYGYEKLTYNQGYNGGNKKIFYMMDPEHIDETLDAAFHNNAVLWWDEINCYLTPHVVVKLQAYLSGHDLEGNLIEGRGLTLISSVNPAYLDGRSEIDQTIRAYLNHQTLPEYTKQEKVLLLDYLADIAHLNNHYRQPLQKIVQEKNVGIRKMENLVNHAKQMQDKEPQQEQVPEIPTPLPEMIEPIKPRLDVHKPTVTKPINNKKYIAWIAASTGCLIVGLGLLAIATMAILGVNTPIDITPLLSYSIGGVVTLLSSLSTTASGYALKTSKPKCHSTAGASLARVMPKSSTNHVTPQGSQQKPSDVSYANTPSFG